LGNSFTYGNNCLCSEVFLVLGFASLIKWELDLAALAGLIAAVGTGIDDQIVVNDELVKEKDVKNKNIVC
jgi:preprotein translocase subunit SecD